MLCIPNKGKEHSKPDQDGGKNYFLIWKKTSCTIPNMENRSRDTSFYVEQGTQKIGKI